MTENRNDRLLRDYREMLKIQDRPYLSWIATKGELPYAEEYLLTVGVRTYVYSAKAGVNTVGAIRRCMIRVTLRDSYPAVAPYIKMLDLPPVFHPDWYSKGAYCPREPWQPETPLKDFVLRMIRSLQYDPAMIRADLPANYKALDWFLKHRDDPALFPSDHTALTENTTAETAAAENAAASFGEIVDRWTAGGQ